MNSRMNLEKAIEIMVNARNKYDETRPVVKLIDGIPPKQEVVKAADKKICEATNMDGKRCKLAINPTFGKYCTRHGKKI
jgi:hypothetical protein